MNNRKISNLELRFVAIGLLLVVVPFLVNDWVPIPDFARGALMGIGIALELIGIFRINKRKRQAPRN